MAAAPRFSVLDRLSALAEPTRGRILLLLDRHELTVGELCTILQLPQSTVSRHLKVLSDDGWVAVRGARTSRFYRMASTRRDPFPHRLWNVVREEVESSAAVRQDARRLQSVLRERRDRSKSYFTTAAGDWNRVRTDLIGARTDLLALLDLLDPGVVVGDLGCGTGPVAEALAPCVKRVVAVDESGAMLSAARRRFLHVANVDVRAGTLEALPLERHELDVALLCLVLHFVVDPPAAFAEVRRVLKPGGRLLVVDFTPHEREQYTVEMGHVWQGFDEPQLRAWLRDAGFPDVRYRHLPPDSAAKGPTLFSALARRGRK
ncbi:MAG TPA: metalloregulator ArsR/SmtB family transcription factor [Gemmatimonadaceae bacterium]|nr:metalloregulator ArsR/SmtB family transcription factor [Gemmatimonadaceae bacterium]